MGKTLEAVSKRSRKINIQTIKILMKPLLAKIFFSLLMVHLFIVPPPLKAAETMAPSNGPVTKNMTVADAVFLALRHNRDIKSAYLNRTAEKFDLEVAEDKFIPDVTVTLDQALEETSVETARRLITRSNTAGSDVKVTEKVPTGADFTFTWSKQLNDEKTIGAVDTDQNSLSLSFTQPLLKNGGIDVNMASVNIAQKSEQSNILDLKSTIESTITSVITSYRSFLQAYRQIDISRNSLKRAQDQFEINKSLIKAGRMAQVELIQTEAELANREFDVQAAMNNLDSARLNLLKILDIDKHTQIVPVDDIDVKAVPLNLDDLIPVAYANRSDYLKSLLNVEIRKIDLLLAENNKLWDLSLRGGFTKDINNDDPGFFKEDSSWNVGLNLEIPLYGDLSRKQLLIRERADLGTAELSHEDLKDVVEIEVRDAVRNAKSRFNQLALARRARELTKKKLEVEEVKLKVGRTTNFALVTFQNDLVTAENNEVRAVIDYQNALTSLDLILGTPLKTWKIEVNDLDQSQYKENFK